MIRVLVARLIEAERRLAALGVDDLLRPVVRSLVRLARPRSERAGVRVAIEAAPSSPPRPDCRCSRAHRALHQLLDRKLVRLEDDVLSSAGPRSAVRVVSTLPLEPALARARAIDRDRVV